MTERIGRVLLLSWAGILAACEPPRPRAPQPEAEGFAFPASQPGETTREQARRIKKGWAAVLTGDTGRAEREFQRVLERRPGLVPAETGLAYARLRSGRFQEAAQRFEAVLVRRPDYGPALIGGASAALRLGQPEAAIAFYRRLQDLGYAAGDSNLRRRIAEVRLQVTERRVADARAALSEGDGERAMETYRLALEDAPEVSGLRMELADLLVDSGDDLGAVALLEADPTGDRQVLVHLGEILAGLGEHRRALDAYRRILDRDPRDEEALRRSREVRQEIELLQMPEEYRRILAAPTIARADLAALISVKVTSLVRIPSGTGKVAVDISGSWARERIIRILALEIMSVYPNHTFQPGAMVRRGDLARAVQRVLDLFGYPAAATPLLADMSRSNLYHSAAARAVAAGLMDLTPEGAFQAWRPVSGPEAVNVIEGLVRLVGP